jgi:uncharacterized phage protein (TIGR01671 family)
MREIKFRVWDIYRNRMKTLKTISFGFSPKKEHLITATSENGDVTDLSNRFVLLQYTGLKDKNGKEIYDGDIMENSLIIKWNQLHNCFGYFSNNGFVKEILSNVYDSKGNLTYCYVGFEIIGNIYENPELLQ